jgi:hypothetical protein
MHAFKQQVDTTESNDWARFSKEYITNKPKLHLHTRVGYNPLILAPL